MRKANHSQTKTIRQMQYYLRRVTYEHYLSHFQQALDKQGIEYKQEELARHIPDQQLAPHELSHTLQLFSRNMLPTSISTATRMCLTSGLSSAEPAVNIGQSLPIKHPIPDNIGLCFGLAIVKATMRELGPEAEAWWLEVLTEHIHHWDSRHPEHLDTPLRLRSKPNETTTLRRLFEKAINYIVFNHACTTNIGGILTSSHRYSQNFHLSHQGWFEYLQQDNTVKRMKNTAHHVQRFLLDQLKQFLQLNQENFSRGIHVVGPSDHMTAIGFNSDSNQWLFYDPNDPRGDWRTFKQISDITKVMIEKLGSDSLGFYCLSGHITNYHTPSTNESPLHAQASADMLSMLASHHPNQLLQWLKRAKSDEDLAKAIINQLNITRYRHTVLSHILKNHACIEPLMHLAQHTNKAIAADFKSALSKALYPYHESSVAHQTFKVILNHRFAFLSLFQSLEPNDTSTQLLTQSITGQLNTVLSECPALNPHLNTISAALSSVSPNTVTSVYLALNSNALLELQHADTLPTQLKRLSHAHIHHQRQCSTVLYSYAGLLAMAVMTHVLTKIGEGLKAKPSLRFIADELMTEIKDHRAYTLPILSIVAVAISMFAVVTNTIKGSRLKSAYIPENTNMPDGIPTSAPTKKPTL